MSQFYIGFTQLEEFIKAADDQRDINLGPLTYTHHGDHISTVVAYVIASQVKGDHLIYCKMNVSKWDTVHGKTFGETSERRAAAAPKLQQQLYDIAAQLITGHLPDMLIQAGAPSFPERLILIDGWPDSATYDKESQSIVLKQYAIADPATEN